MKPVYVYFSFRHNKKEDRMFVATAMYADPDGKVIVGLKIDEAIPWEDSNYVKSLQAYANALNYIYSMQDKLMAKGVTTVVLMTDNKVLYNWIETGKCHGFSEWFKMIHKPFRVGASKEIVLQVSLGEIANSDLAYKYCKADYIGKKLEVTYRGVSIVDDEEQQGVAKKAAVEEEVKLLSIEEILKRDGIASNVEIDGFVD